MSGKSNEIAVSVIVPAYNAESTLESSLDSILAQTLDNIEIIVINDGSADQTGEILKRYQDLFPEKIVGIHKENEGVSAARNDGLEISRGEYIGFVDADDFVAPTMFEEMYTHAKEKDADLVQCWRFDVTPEGQQIRGPKKLCTGASIYENPEIISGQTLCIWDKIFRRKIISENAVHFEKYRYAEDILFIFQFELFASNIEEIQRPLYYYQVRREGAVTASFGDALLDAPKALARMNDLALDAGYFAQFERYLWRLEAHYYVRRLNDFWLYSNKELQEKQAKLWFELFEWYFYNWKNTIRKVGARKKIQVFFNAYRSDWNKMLKFIYYPSCLKRVCRKLVFLTVKCLRWKDKVKEAISQKRTTMKKVRKAISRKKITMKYAKYRKKPLQANTILLTSYYGSSFSDSMYYIAKELLQEENVTVYIGTNSIKREQTFIHYNCLEPILVDVNSEKYLEILATAHYLVCNSRFPSFFFKREGQVYLNTWHGTPLKTLGKDMHSGLKDVGNNQTNFLMCDYLLYPNEYTRTNIMNSFFLDRLYTNQTVMCGYPRNAAFFDVADSAFIRKKMRLENKQVYLYMPTWRGESLATAEIAAYTEELEFLLETLDELLDDDIVIFVKLHQVVMRKIKIKQYSHIRLPHPLYENYRFVNMADGLITDYSSVFFDFANTKKEIILFTYDYERYMEQRGMYFDMGTLPFKRIDAVEELAAHLNKKDSFYPDNKYLEFCKEYCSYDSGKSPKYICDILMSKKVSDQISIESFEKNKLVRYRIYFISNLKQPDQKEQFEQLVNHAQENDLFVFAQWSFCTETDEVLNRYANSGIQYVVTPGEMPATGREYIKLLLFRKFSLFSRSAAKLYEEELHRILPGIQVGSIVNCSNDPKFTDICRALKVNGSNDKPQFIKGTN